ncbi:hypothetical protein [Polyangium aurulentum]|uniref:hypothetical protein n=1 Tax=Polyangium aurulentum TaxID=2567896 RepID=UPI001F2B4A20|nr:hypothetical protein [Polyangium aurulentum]
MSGLVACPFCREMFEAGEARTCPECGLALQDVTKLPPSRDEDDEPVPPHMETLPWAYLGRWRGVLVALAVLGLVAFFLPWMRETAPEIREMSGFAFARRLSWMWAPGVAWFVMLPLVLTRRSIHAMRGARFAVGLLALIVIMTVALRVARVPESSRIRPVRFEWAYGLHATFVLGLAALVAAVRFGGRVDDVPTQKHRRRGDETLH